MRFDFEDTFGEDYLHFYRSQLTDDRNRADADDISGDLRELPVDGPFDAALRWFTSFGYFDDDDNRKVLSEYRRVLRPGGRLLIETQHRDEFVRRFTPTPSAMPWRSAMT